MGTELLVGLLLVASFSNIQPAQAAEPVKEEQASLLTVDARILPKNVLPKPQSLTLKDLPWEMQKVAFCESGSRQFDGFGRVIKNRVGTPDYGLFQINAVHFPEAKSLGLDVMKEEDNIKFAMVLYKRNGLADWKASRQCLARYGIKV